MAVSGSRDQDIVPSEGQRGDHLGADDGAGMEEGVRPNGLWNHLLEHIHHLGRVCIQLATWLF